MAKNSRSLLVGLLIVAAAPAAYAQLEVGGSLLDNCAAIDALQKAGKFTEARDKANQCLQGIEQALQGQVGTFFRTDIAGWKRKSFDQNVVLGFANISATYEKNGTPVSVSLTRGESGSDSVGAGLGKLLGGLARAGLQSNGRPVRVGGLPGTVQQNGTIVVTMDDGAFLSFESSRFKDGNSALAGMGELINAFPVADINKTLHKK